MLNGVPSPLKRSWVCSTKLSTKWGSLNQASTVLKLIIFLSKVIIKCEKSREKVPYSRSFQTSIYQGEKLSENIFIIDNHNISCHLMNNFIICLFISNEIKILVSVSEEA